MRVVSRVARDVTESELRGAMMVCWVERMCNKEKAKEGETTKRNKRFQNNLVQRFCDETIMMMCECGSEGWCVGEVGCYGHDHSCVMVICGTIVSGMV